MTANTLISVRWQVEPEYVYPTYQDRDANMIIYFQEKTEEIGVITNWEHYANREVLVECSKYFQKRLWKNLDSKEDKHIYVSSGYVYKENVSLGHREVFPKILKFMEQGEVVITVKQLPAFAELMEMYSLIPPSTKEFTHRFRDKKYVYIEYLPFEGHYYSAVHGLGLPPDMEFRINEEKVPAHKNLIKAGSSVLAESLGRQGAVIYMGNTISPDMLGCLISMMKDRKVKVATSDLQTFGLKMIEYNVRPFKLRTMSQKMFYDVKRHVNSAIEILLKAANWIQAHVKVESDFPNLNADTRAKVNAVKNAIVQIGVQADELQSHAGTQLSEIGTTVSTFSNNVRSVVLEVRDIIVHANDKTTEFVANISHPETPSGPPTETPSGPPTETPSGPPTETPSGLPTETPSGLPTETPSGPPTETPFESTSEMSFESTSKTALECETDMEWTPEQAGRRTASPLSPRLTFEDSIGAIASVVSGYVVAATAHTSGIVSGFIAAADQSTAQANVRDELRNTAREVRDKIRALSLASFL